MAISITPNVQAVSQASNHLFLDLATVSPASTSSPTLTEISTAAGTNVDVTAYYTGTNTSTDAPTHVYHIDGAGDVKLLLAPTAAGGVHLVHAYADLAGLTPAEGDIAFVEQQKACYSYESAAWGYGGAINGQVNFGWHESSNFVTNADLTSADLDLTLSATGKGRKHMIFVQAGAVPGSTYNVEAPTTGLGDFERITISFHVFGTLAPVGTYNFTFDSTFRVAGGGSALGPVALTSDGVNSHMVTFEFVRIDDSNGSKQWYLKYRSDSTSGSNIYDTDGALTGVRTVDLAGAQIDYTEGGVVQARTNEGGHESLAFRFIIDEHIFATGVPYVPDGSRQSVRLIANATSTGDLDIGALFPTSYGSETLHIVLRNSDAIVRNFVFNSVFKGFDGTTDFGTVAQPDSNTGDRSLIFIPSQNSLNWTLIADSNGLPAGELTATKIDSSGGATDEVLDASTNLGAVRLFTNIDVASNTAALSVQAGETLNGVTDAEFLFSNYANGTQFRADEVAGGWVVSVVGSATSTDKSFYAYGVLDDLDPVAGSNVIDFTTLVAGGNYAASEGNASGWRTSATDFTPPADGAYKFGLNVYHPGSAIVGSNNQVGMGSFRAQVIINGTPVDFSFDGETGAPDAANGVIVHEVLTTDTIQFAFNASSDTNEDFYVNAWIEPLTQQEVVLAGMVTPENVREVVYAKTTALGFGPTYTFDNSATWNDLKTAYEYLEFNCEIDVTGVTDDVLRTITIKTADIRDDTRWRFEYGSGVVDFQPGALTGGDFSFTGSVVDQIAVEIVGVKAQQTVVMADALTPEALSYARFSLSADAVGIICPFDEAIGDTGVITNAAGTITVPAGKYRIQCAATRAGLALDYEIWNVTDGVSIEKFTNSESSVAANASHMPVYVTFSVATDIQVREGDSGTSVTWNGRQVGLDAGFNDVQPNFGCYIDIQQLPSYTVVAAEDLSVDDQSASGYIDLGNTRMQWGNGVANGTITFPQPFADTSYAVTTTAYSGGNGQLTHLSAKSTTDFTTIGMDVNAAFQNHSFSWIAIGAKP